MAKYKVLGLEGDLINLGGVDYKKGDVVELDADGAAAALAASKVELVEEDAPVAEAPVAEAPVVAVDPAVEGGDTTVAGEVTPPEGAGAVVTASEGTPAGDQQPA